jgi:hypothetical protein
VLPRLGRTHPDKGGHGRGESDGVVRVEDASHQGERQERDDEPATPDEVCGASGVRARSPPPEVESGGEQEQRGRDEPGDLAADLGVEHPAEPGGTPVAAAPADRAGLVAGNPPEAVVAEGQLEERVRLGAADVRPHALRQELDDRDPPAGREDDGQATKKDVPDALRQ